MGIANKPDVSKAIAWTYGAMAAFIAISVAFFVYAGAFTPMGTVGFVAATGAAVVEAVMLSILRSLYSTRYVLTDDELSIETTRLIGGNRRIGLKTIASIEKTLIPFGVKIFGASFHGGHYQIPGLGRAFLAIANYKDGLLIRAGDRSYVITPSDPSVFKQSIERRMV